MFVDEISLGFVLLVEQKKISEYVPLGSRNLNGLFLYYFLTFQRINCQSFEKVVGRLIDNENNH